MAGEESQDEAGTPHRGWWLAAGLLALLLVLGLVVLWVRTPALYGTGDAAKTATATTRGAILTVAAALIAATAAGAGLYMTARTIRVNQRALAETQRANRASEERARDEQLTDRYTKTVEQLGNEKLDVRLGGIYALERLMVDCERDHPTIVEVLAAFLREHATTPTTATRTASPPAVGAVAREENVPLAPMPADIVGAARVIARRPPGRDERGPLDLRRCYLSGANLSGANLSGANLSDAHLSDAHLSDAHLSDAYLFRVNLVRANLSGADLSGADLSDVGTFHANLSDAILSDAILRGANLRGAILSGAYLEGANLSDAVLSGATLRGAYLEGADLTNADLTNADLTGAKRLTYEQLGAAMSTDGVRLPDYLAAKGHL